MSNELRDFLRLSYTELEDMNLQAKEQRLKPRSHGDHPRRASQVPD